MNRLAQNTFPAERLRGAVFAETFESNQAIAMNGGTIAGSPVINFGATLDGIGDYITYPTTDVLNTPEISFVIEFIPDFDYDEDKNIWIFCSSAQDYQLLKFNNASANILQLFLGNTQIVNISQTVYRDYWLPNKRNVLTISGTDGDTSVWLNGHCICDAIGIAWTPINVAVLSLGASHLGGDPFEGQFKSFKVFDVTLTQQEALDYYQDSTFVYRNKCVVDLQFRNQDHDIANNKSLDSSHHGNHATLHGGVTKDDKHGYSFDGKVSYKIS